MLSTNIFDVGQHVRTKVERKAAKALSLLSARKRQNNVLQGTGIVAHLRRTALKVIAVGNVWFWEKVGRGAIVVEGESSGEKARCLVFKLLRSVCPVFVIGSSASSSKGYDFGSLNVHLKQHSVRSRLCLA